MKKLLFLALALCLVISSAGCGGSGSTTGTGSPSGKSAETSAAASTAAAASNGENGNLYAGIDTSEPVDINMTVLGDKPAGLNEVLEKANKKLKEKINVTLSVNFIPLSEVTPKYKLLLASGRDLDLVFTAPWCYFQEEVRKKAFRELTRDFIAKYMPATNKAQAPASWKQISIDGKIYAVPRNESDFDTVYGALIRGDLRKKYNIPPLKSLADFENYLLTIASKEHSGIYAFYIFPSFPVSIHLLAAAQNWFTIIAGYSYVWDVDNGAFRSDDMKFIFDTPEFKEYALRMARWSKAGVWPSSAINGTVHTDDLFKAGKSAADLAHYKKADELIKACASNGINDVEYYNIFDKNVRVQRSPYYYDSCAISTSGTHPERAAMTLDVIKNDKEINLLLVGGVKGEHYILNPDNTHSPGPKAADYPWDGWTWCIRNNWNPVLGGMNEMVKDVRKEFQAIEMKNGIWPCDGFTFNDSSIKAEQAVVNSIITEYQYSFDLGVYGSETASMIDKMRSDLKAAGIDKVTAEFKRQLKAYTGK